MLHQKERKIWVWLAQFKNRSWKLERSRGSALDMMVSTWIWNYANSWTDVNPGAKVVSVRIISLNTVTCAFAEGPLQTSHLHLVQVLPTDFHSSLLAGQGSNLPRCRPHRLWQVPVLAMLTSHKSQHRLQSRGCFLTSYNAQLTENSSGYLPTSLV